jgi:hypothetical protein
MGLESKNITIFQEVKELSTVAAPLKTLALIVPRHLALLCAAGLFLFMPSTHAQTVPDSCDVDFMTQMVSRATAEASRDVMVSQTVIRKPDSVLQYTCFDQIAKLTGTIAGPLFTENTKWQSATIDVSSYDDKHSPGPVNISVSAFQPSNTVDNAVKDIVLDAMKAYTDKNFGHKFLGDHAGSISNPGAGGDYNCTIMQQVWNAAKCENFNTDDLFTELNAPKDLREKPKACNNPYDAPTYDYDVDIYDTFVERTNRNAPGPPPPTCEAFKAIQTGRQVEIITFSKGLLGTTNRSSIITGERICLLPGCSYDYKAGKCIE